jgi:hypothetical protein
MAQALKAWFICDGRFRVLATSRIGRRKGRIVEVEVVDTGERFHGSAQRMESLVRKLSGQFLHISDAEPVEL